MKNLFPFVLFASALLAGGCAFFGNGTLELSQKDSGGTFTVPTGSFIEVTLDSNPTTGYLWNFASRSDESVIALGKDEFLAPDSQLCGAGGKRFLRFEVIGPGKTGINLKYVRPWEKDAKPAELFQVMIYAAGKPKSASPGEEEKVVAPRRGSRGQDAPVKNVFDD